MSELIILPGVRSGSIEICPSKSMAHRILICSALSNAPVTVKCEQLSDDVKATISCLIAMGADIKHSSGYLHIKPIGENKKENCTLYCGESASTLRFLLPVVGALGINAVFKTEGALGARPIKQLADVLCRNGMSIMQNGEYIYVCGALDGGTYTIDGEISSQYISGLLMALPVLKKHCELCVTGDINSKNYIKMTESVLERFNISFKKQDNKYIINSNNKYIAPENLYIEGDYSNAAAFFAMGAFSQKGITVSGLDKSSLQGDREILSVLERMGAQVTQNDNGVTVKSGALSSICVDGANMPDIIPVIAVVAAVTKGKTVIKNTARLKIKECDRSRAVTELIRALGGNAAEYENHIEIFGGAPLCGGIVNTYGDHRMAMVAAVAACACSENITVTNSECVKKSYPRFWEDFNSLERYKKWK